tara:strand:+ start:53 stop:319 length:267 start_codon:yes stop_codon:yes gene_type:complete
MKLNEMFEALENAPLDSQIVGAVMIFTNEIDNTNRTFEKKLVLQTLFTELILGLGREKYKELRNSEIKPEDLQSIKDLLDKIKKGKEL